jgi:two-component system, chemotaxis family, sensor kinase Cph1
MEDVAEFFRGLFDTDRWPPRWKCGHWTEFHGWMYIISDLMIWLAYFLIPLIIISYFTQKKTKIRFHAVYLLFASFILLCGTTHFLDTLMFWEPMYRFNALVRFVTGVVSLITVYHLVRLLPSASKMPTSMELEFEISNRRKAEQELAEANMRLAAFASIASHDLQEPVRKIIIYADILQTKSAESLDETSRSNTQKIIQSATRMQGLIKDVLTLSSLPEQVELKPVDADEALQVALDNLEVRISESGATIKSDKLPLVQGHTPYLSQLFTNLIGNAIKFNNNKPVINISAFTTDVITIKIQDNGIGIDSQHHQRIFEAFQRLHSRSSKFDGTGIGLAICKRVMDIHGGTITVESSPGEGSTFILTFPRPSKQPKVQKE